MLHSSIPIILIRLALGELDVICMISNPNISGLRTENVPIVDSQISEHHPLYDSGLIEARDNATDCRKFR